MALANVVGTAIKETSFSELVREALKNAPMGHEVRIAWQPSPETSAKLAPLADQSNEYRLILLAHAEKTMIDGQAVKLTDQEQRDLYEQRTLLDQERIEIVRKAMNSERNTHASAAKSYAEVALPNVKINVGTETNVDPTLCRFLFTKVRKLTRSEAAQAIAARFRKPQPQEPAKAKSA